MVLRESEFRKSWDHTVKIVRKTDEASLEIIYDSKIKTAGVNNLSIKVIKDKDTFIIEEKNENTSAFYVLTPLREKDELLFEVSYYT